MKRTALILIMICRAAFRPSPTILDGRGHNIPICVWRHSMKVSIFMLFARIGCLLCIGEHPFNKRLRASSADWTGWIRGRARRV